MDRVWSETCWSTFKYFIIFIVSYLLTPWCKVLLEKLTDLLLVKKFPAFHRTFYVFYAFVHLLDSRVFKCRDFVCYLISALGALSHIRNIFLVSVSGEGMAPPACTVVQTFLWPLWILTAVVQCRLKQIFWRVVIAALVKLRQDRTGAHLH